jgi:small-conductance mechanosensitive channel
VSELLLDLRELLGTHLFTVAGTPIDLGTLILFVVILGITLLLSKLAERATERFMERRGARGHGSVGVAGRLVNYLFVAIGLAVALNMVGINLTALFAAGAVFAVAIGFAMQNIAQNFMSGVILLTERTIKPGDILEVNGTMVRVLHLGIRSTVARTLDEEDLIIPNADLVQSTVKNYTLRDSSYRVRIPVGVVYSADMDLTRRTLIDAATRLPGRDPERDPVIYLTDFGSSSVDFEISVWIGDPWLHRRVRSELHYAVWNALHEVGVTIAFPQLDVHLDPAVVERMGPPRGA